MLLLAALFLVMTAAVSGQTLTAPVYDEDGILEIDELKDCCEWAWAEWGEAMFANQDLITELENFALAYGDLRMRFTVETIGDKPENGYPLYIAMHGGGYGETPDVNDSQWEDMQYYYSEPLECGVYVAVRGIRDTWDTHFNPESYPLYDKLIECMIIFSEVDPNRVYLMGFSAGGDGVYAVGARMADRFAAANMSSGHPNGISMANFYHLPIQLQAGEFDTDYDRNTMTAYYGILLNELMDDYPDGYIHRTLIHADRGHNYEDYDRIPVSVYSDIYGWMAGESNETQEVNSFPPDWMDQFARDPLPETVRWDLDTRAELRETDSFYYLSADKSASGLIQAARDGQNFRIETEDLNGDFMIYFNEDMIDFYEPVHFEIEGEGEADVLLYPEAYWLHYTTFDRGDPNYQFEAAVSYQWLLANMD